MRGPGALAPYRRLFAVGEFRAVWGAQAVSLLGDQLARVALTVLVFARTGSPALAAVSYAASFLPWAVGGPLLAGWADRLPRRQLMIGCDLGRAAVVGALAAAALPVLALPALLFAAELLSPPFAAARSALLPDLLDGGTYPAGSVVRGLTHQGGQLVGLAAAGAVVAAIGARPALGLDAASFLVSALLVAAGVRRRPAPRAGRRPRTWDTARQLVADPRLRSLVGLAGYAGFAAAPEALAVPLAHRLGGGAALAGLLLAAPPAGLVLAGPLLGGPWAQRLRARLGPALALLSLAPLVALAAHPDAVVTGLALAVSGAGSGYNLLANTAFVERVAPDARGRAFGLVNALLYLAQAAVMLLAGGLASRYDPFDVVAGVGLAGLAVAVVCWPGWRAALATPGRAAGAGTGAFPAAGRPSAEPGPGANPAGTPAAVTEGR